MASLAELNRLIAAGDLLDDTRVITGRPQTVAEAFAAELPTLQALPVCGSFTLKPDRRAVSSDASVAENLPLRSVRFGSLLLAAP